MGSLKLTKGKMLLICFAVFAAAIAAITVFKVSVGNLLYFGIFLACPLMHIFMMKGHGGHDHGGKDNTKQSGKSCH